MSAVTTDFASLSEAEYRRRIRAWVLYDWANSAFATTILAAVLPVYYSQVAGATLPSPAWATAYWSVGVSVALLITAVLSPILGTISDIKRGKKPFLAISIAVGVIGVGLLVFVNTGDWLLASAAFIIGRIGFSASIVFYDAMLPHVARSEDQDMVSTRGYAFGYLGGGLLLAINIAMIFLLPEDNLGSRLSFLSVAIWWAVFSVPVLRVVPEPPAASLALGPGESVLGATFSRLRTTFSHLRRYRELLKFLIAFLIYNDGIGTIIGVAAIYGAELGFGTIELISAILLVQFVGIPYSLIFGRLPRAGDARRPVFLAFILFNIVALPLAGIAGSRLLAPEQAGAPRAALPAGEGLAEGETVALADDARLDFVGAWEPVEIPAETLGEDTPVTYLYADEPGARLAIPFSGQKLSLTYSTGPDHGIWRVLVDGEPLVIGDEPVTIDAYREEARYEVTRDFTLEERGEHVLVLERATERNPASDGDRLGVAEVEVLPPPRPSSLPLIIGLLLALEGLGLLLAFLLGPTLFSRLAEAFDTKRSIFLALVAYGIIATWGYFLNSVIEFWFLAWMVAVVQGGSQALSRSLYASMSPAARSGEFFGFFSVMEKASSFSGPLLFALAVAIFGSSRPGVLSLILFFIVGGFLLTRVDVEEGRRMARAEDAAMRAAGQG
jgi:UMF1 family MFS transporter